MSRKEALLLLLLLTCYTFFVQWTGAEQRSFFSLILAMNNEHTLVIDRYADLTVDKALYNGHYYADKAPGLSFLGLPVYAVLNAMQNLNRPGLSLPYSIYMVNAFIVALPGALLALLVLRFLRRIGTDEAHAFAVTIVMALGTLAFPFSTLLFSHQTSAFFVFAAFFSLFAAKTESPKTIRLAALLALGGLLAGLAVVTEYPLAIMALLLLFYALSFVSDKRLVVFYLLGALPPALFMMAYNTAAFGHPLHFGYFYETNPWAGVHQTGILGLGMPRLSTLVTILVGARGLFTLAPVLILAVIGLALMLRDERHRAEAVLFASAFAVYVLMTSGYKVPPTDIWVPGPRFLIPILPFLAAPLAFSLRRWTWAFIPLAAISIAIMFLVTACNPQVPPEVANPLFQHWIPGLLNKGQIVHSLPEFRFGISRTRSLGVLVAAIMIFAAAAAILWRLRKQPQVQSRVLSTVTVLMLAVYLLIFFPIDLRRPFDVPLSLQGATTTEPATQAPGTSAEPGVKP